jgi:AAA+ ATPase superfamily predicted ATPase
MKCYKVKTTKIEYCVEEEDVCDEIANDPEIEEDSEEYYDAIHNEIKWLRETLPQVLVLEIECDLEDLDDMVGDAITNETGWLVEWFNYDILEEKEIEE